jgi:hypothetical protein
MNNNITQPAAQSTGSSNGLHAKKRIARVLAGPVLVAAVAASALGLASPANAVYCATNGQVAGSYKCLNHKWMYWGNMVMSPR